MHSESDLAHVLFRRLFQGTSLFQKFKCFDVRFDIQNIRVSIRKAIIGLDTEHVLLVILVSCITFV